MMASIQNGRPQMIKVVVVNDDVIQNDLLCRLLIKGGMQPIAFFSAETALAGMTQDIPPALIITDIHMPGIDGWRFCRLLRSSEYARFNQVPILVVSATYSGDEPSRITSDLGANAFLSMPLDANEFLNLVHRLLKGEKQQDILKVLIVEDSQLVSQRLVAAFQAHGYQAEAAFSYSEGLTLLERTDYDIAVLDYHLPDGLGDGLLQILPTKSSACVGVMMTADPQPELALTWMKMGAAAYLRKPFEPDYLIAQCERARRERALLRTQDLLEIRTRQLQDSEEKYRHLVIYSSDPIFAFNPDETYRFVNEAFARPFGKKPEEIIGKTPHALFPHDEAEKRLALVRRVFKTGEKGEIEVKVLRQTGQASYYLTLVDPIKNDLGKVIYITCISKDITERKQAEQALKHSHDLMRYVIEHNRSAIAVHDRNLKYIYVSQRYLQEYQVKETDVIGKHYYDVFPDLPQKWRDVHQKALAGEISSAEDDPYVREDGSVDWTRWECRPWYEADGSIGGFIVYTEVITERKRMEMALRESEEKYRLIVENQQDFLVKTDVEGHFLYANMAYCDLLDKSEEELLGTGYLSLVCPDDLQVVEKAVVLLFKPPFECAYEERVNTRHGWRWLSWVGKAVLDGQGVVTALISSGRDITERKQAEDKINVQLEELRRWQNITLGREDRILELKREVNRLLSESGRPPRYASAAEVCDEI